LTIGVANGDGDVNISASGYIGEPDTLSPPDNRAGEKIWLVPRNDLSDAMEYIEAWNQGSIHFENTLVNTP